MGDSNDDRKRTSKFRNERANYRDERGNRKRREYRDYDQTSPKLKRIKRDQDDRMAAPYHNRGPPIIPFQSTSMKTFKQFLSSQNDAISDREAVTKYGEYKLDFGRRRVDEFFRSHKSEEWFKCKYHPEECAKRLVDETNGVKKRLNDDEARKLGKKNWETEVEKFIRENTQELSKDKWLCPLSGKKFKDAGFVRKHIFNKHSERIEEVKNEVEFFNNYLMDPERPQSPERVSPTPTPQSEMYSAPTNYRKDPRKLVTYRDLDAPDDQFW